MDVRLIVQYWKAVESEKDIIDAAQSSHNEYILEMTSLNQSYDEYYEVGPAPCLTRYLECECFLCVPRLEGAADGREGTRVGVRRDWLNWSLSLWHGLVGGLRFPFPLTLCCTDARLSHCTLLGCANELIAVCTNGPPCMMDTGLHRRQCECTISCLAGTEYSAVTCSCSLSLSCVRVYHQM